MKAEGVNDPQHNFEIVMWVSALSESLPDHVTHVFNCLELRDTRGQTQ